MLSFTNMMHSLANKFASLRARRLPFLPILFRLLNRHFFRRVCPPYVKIEESTCIVLAAVLTSAR